MMNLFLRQDCGAVLLWSVPSWYSIAAYEYLLLKILFVSTSLQAS